MKDFAAIGDFRACLSDPMRAVCPIRRGTMNAPPSCAPQGETWRNPHARAEADIVNRGESVFVNNGRHYQCGAGGLMFAGAGAARRFAELTSDFLTWAAFYGARGGESKIDAAAGRGG